MWILVECMWILVELCGLLSSLCGFLTIVCGLLSICCRVLVYLILFRSWCIYQVEFIMISRNQCLYVIINQKFVDDIISLKHTHAKFVCYYIAGTWLGCTDIVRQCEPHACDQQRRGCGRILYGHNQRPGSCSRRTMQFGHVRRHRRCHFQRKSTDTCL